MQDALADQPNKRPGSIKNIIIFPFKVSNAINRS